MKTVQVKLNDPKDNYNGAVGIVVDELIVSGQMKFANVKNGVLVEVCFDDGEQFSVKRQNLELVAEEDFNPIA